MKIRSNHLHVQESQLCVICSRKETQYLYYDMVFNGVVYNTVIQRFGNMVGEDEYAVECMLQCTQGEQLVCMPKPIMSHQRNKYVVFRDKHDVIRMRQVRVSPQDFVDCREVCGAEAGTTDILQRQRNHCLAMGGVPCMHRGAAVGGETAATTTQGYVARIGSNKGF